MFVGKLMGVGKLRCAYLSCQSSATRRMVEKCDCLGGDDCFHKFNAWVDNFYNYCEYCHLSFASLVVLIM